MKRPSDCLRGLAHSHAEWRFSRETSSVDDGNEARMSVNTGDHIHANPIWAHTSLLSQSRSNYCMTFPARRRTTDYSARKDTEYTVFWIPGPKVINLKIHKWKKYKFLTTDAFRQTQIKLLLATIFGNSSKYQVWNVCNTLIHCSVTFWSADLLKRRQNPSLCQDSNQTLPAKHFYDTQ